MDDLDALALAMPGTLCRRTADGRPSYLVNGKLFCCHRADRPDALDAAGRRLDDVLLFRVEDEGVKASLLAEPKGRFFTTPHFDGYPAVLVRIGTLRRVPRAELFELVADAWLTRAPKRVATAWLAEQGL
jgi:hypothetical protein